MSGEGRLDVDALLADLQDPTPEGHRSGLVALVGRPNVGKSTLLNAMVGEKVAIVTDVPGTTRNAIRAVVTRDDAQIVFLDTPGLAKPRTLLTRRLNDLVENTWSGVDLVLFLVDVAGGVGPGDRHVAGRLKDLGAPVVVVANKEDLVGDKGTMIPHIAELQELLEPREVVPTSATTGMNVEHLLDVITEHLPEGPRLLPPDVVTDQAERHIAAEVLREKVIRGLHHELPHSVAVVVDEVSTREDGLVQVPATLYVERDSQKGIVIGRGGSNLKRVGTEAREELEVLFGAKVHLDVRVKVAKDWQRDPKQLGRLGY